MFKNNEQYLPQLPITKIFHKLSLLSVKKLNIAINWLK